MLALPFVTCLFATLPVAARELTVEIVGKTMKKELVSVPCRQVAAKRVIDAKRVAAGGPLVISVHRERDSEVKQA